MNTMKRLFFITLALCILAVSCEEKPEPEPESSPAPVLVSTNPGDGVSQVEGSSLSVVFTFDQNIKCTLSKQAGISIDGGAKVDKVNTYNTDLTVAVSGLAAGSSYVITIPEGTVDGFKTNQKGSAAISFRFSTKDDEPEPSGRMEPGTDAFGWENAAAAARNMGAGWNLGNTLDSNSGDVDNMWIEAFSDRSTPKYETAWGQPVTTRALIHMFKEAGFNAIRVPVTWYPHIGTVTVTVSDNRGHWDMSTWTGYDVDPAWMARVKEVVDYVIDEGMYCILNVHHDTGDATTGWLKADKAVYAAVKERYCALWKQIATEFEPYGQKLLFESFNEMLDSKGTWNYSTDEAHETINMYNADFVATVRATGGNNGHRNLILNTYGASCQKEALEAFRLPADTAEDHLLAEVHSYAPYDFAFDMTGNPYVKQRTVFDSYCETEVRRNVENMDKYLVSKGIPCILGEYGCTAIQSATEIAKQAACYVSAAAKSDIACFYWMALSDGEDRSVPKWTAPTLRDAILKAYKENKND